MMAQYFIKHIVKLLPARPIGASLMPGITFMQLFVSLGVLPPDA